MNFYNMLQMNPGDLKASIKKAETKKDKNKLRLALVTRAILLVLFSIVFIGPLGTIFGQENSPMAVAIFCILLSVRFVDFGYKTTSALVNFAIVFAILLFAPVLASISPAPVSFFIHLIGFFAIAIMTLGDPRMGNSGLFGFCYIYLSGNPVLGQSLINRSLMALTGYVICGLIYFFKFRNRNKEIKFLDTIKSFKMSNPAHRMIVRLALGIAITLTLGQILKTERAMWVGFACASILGTYPYNENIKERFWQRLGGIVAGSLIFAAIYMILPESLHSLLGPLGGLLIGFAATYHCKTAINCLGALLMASGIYGTHSAVMLRIGNNLFGLFIGLAIIWLYDIFVDRRFNKEPQK